MAEKRTSRDVVPRKRRSVADRGPGKRITFPDRYRLLELHRTNPSWSYDRLAAETGIGSDTVRMTCIAASKNAADLMAAYAEPMLRQWLKAGKVASTRGDHRPAKDWLLHAGSIEPIPDSSRSSGPAVVIINAPLPGMPGGTSGGTLTIDVANPAEPKGVLSDPEPDRGE